MVSNQIDWTKLMWDWAVTERRPWWGNCDSVTLHGFVSWHIRLTFFANKWTQSIPSRTSSDHVSCPQKKWSHNNQAWAVGQRSPLSTDNLRKFLKKRWDRSWPLSQGPSESTCEPWGGSSGNTSLCWASNTAVYRIHLPPLIKMPLWVPGSRTVLWSYLVKLLWNWSSHRSTSHISGYMFTRNILI